MTDINQAPAFNYVEEANVTLSKHFHGELVSFFAFKRDLMIAIEALSKLDKYKKAIYYGRDTGLPMPEHCNSLATLQRTERDELIMHAILGFATEGGELLEATYAWLNNDVAVFDAVNLKEEGGDGMWYMAILAKACGFTLEDMQRTNIAKLRLRYKDKFDAYDANNRNLVAERSVLENSSLFTPGLDLSERDNALMQAEDIARLYDLGTPIGHEIADAISNLRNQSRINTYPEQIAKIEQATPYGKFGVAPGAIPTDNGIFNSLPFVSEEVAAECEISGKLHTAIVEENDCLGEDQ